MSLKSKAVPRAVRRPTVRHFFIDRCVTIATRGVSPKQIVAIRKTLKLTQAKLAEQIGAQRPTIARWETGRNMPKGAYLKALEALAAKSKAKIGTMRKQPVALRVIGSAKRTANRSARTLCGRRLRAPRSRWGSKTFTSTIYAIARLPAGRWQGSPMTFASSPRVTPGDQFISAILTHRMNRWSRFSLNKWAGVVTTLLHRN